MIRLAIVTALLLVAIVVIRRKQRLGPGGDVLRVASRTGISRGVMAAVIEVEQRRFLVTITATSTTLVAELGPTGLPLEAPSPSVAAATPTAPAVAEATEAPGRGAPLLVGAPADRGDGLLDRLRARTVRAYDPALVDRLRAER